MAAPKPNTQLALDLPVEPRLSAEDFLVGPSNEDAYLQIEQWPAWPDQALILVGPEGSGKTHLAAIWAERAHAWRVEARAVTSERVPELASSGALLIEDADRGAIDEAAMFHLLNLMRARGGWAVLTARSAPDAWGIATPDLVKHFLDRQLVVDTSVIESIALRIPRSFAQARAVVASIDKAALESGKRVTRAFAAAFADELGSAAE